MRTMMEIIQDKLSNYNQICGAEKIYRKVIKELKDIHDIPAQHILCDAMISLQKEINAKQVELRDEIDNLEKPAHQKVLERVGA